MAKNTAEELLQRQRIREEFATHLAKEEIVGLPTIIQTIDAKLHHTGFIDKLVKILMPILTGQLQAWTEEASRRLAAPTIPLSDQAIRERAIAASRGEGIATKQLKVPLRR